MYEDKGQLAEKLFRQGFSCSQAILCAYSNNVHMTQNQARAVATPYAGGAYVKCGAIIAADMIINYWFGNGDVSFTADIEALSKIEEFESGFIASHSHIECRALRNQANASCARYVRDAAQLLQDISPE